MTRPSKAREQAIGPFEYEEAVNCIKRFALALTNLGLNNRFTVEAFPQRIARSGRWHEFEEEREHALYQVILVDRHPDKPIPSGLTTLRIRAAENQGYKKNSQVKQYEAFGEFKNLNQWAKAVGVTWPTLKSRIDAGMTMEEALTQIALKKASR